jgi:hypothetical protein
LRDPHVFAPGQRTLSSRRPYLFHPGCDPGSLHLLQAEDSFSADLIPSSVPTSQQARIGSRLRCVRKPQAFEVNSGRPDPRRYGGGSKPSASIACDRCRRRVRRGGLIFSTLGAVVIRFICATSWKIPLPPDLTPVFSTDVTASLHRKPLTMRKKTPAWGINGIRESRIASILRGSHNLKFATRAPISSVTA